MKNNTTYNKLLSEADDFFAIARKEYAAGKKNNNDKGIRQGAEKAWNASVQATKALAARRGEKIPRSYNAQFLLLRQIEKENQPALNGFPVLSSMFSVFAKGLHGECFYHGEYTLEELNFNFEDVKRYIEIIKHLANSIQPKKTMTND